MTQRTQTARDTAAALREFAQRLDQTPVTIGFDGFVDSIISVVDKRHDFDTFDKVPTIEEFGQKILAAAGHSSNCELVTNLEKLGGNGPIMANAMASIGFPVTYIGNLGYPAIHHAFEPLVQKAECITFCEPGYTDALEFDDGKVMLGKHGTLRDVTAERIKEIVGNERLIEIVSRSRLLGMVNWTMLTQMDGIWDYLRDEILPSVNGERRWIFIDLADPEKRTREDLLKGLAGCTAFQEFADVVLGYNLSEAIQVAEALDINPTPDPEANIEPLAVAIRERLGVHTVVIHPRSGAAAASLNGAGGAVVSASFAGPLVKKPKLSTGAGDNFNAGFCLGRLAGLSIEQSLCTGCATSGYYVRNAGSPTLAALADFCDDLPAPE
ncbi:MAG: carbohydrate kinase family protein [Planctomycetota bacterium]|jgi:sugar/nucleoside kinase (ribokinase family)